MFSEPRGNLRQLMHVLADGKKQFLIGWTKMILGGILYPKIGSSSPPVVNCKMCCKVRFPLLPPGKANCVEFKQKQSFTVGFSLLRLKLNKYMHLTSAAFSLRTLKLWRNCVTETTNLQWNTGEETFSTIYTNKNGLTHVNNLHRVILATSFILPWSLTEKKKKTKT